MKKSKLDEIRERIGVKGLSEEEKKELFRKFVEAGGKVVDLEKDKEKEIKKTWAKDEKISLKNVEKEGSSEDRIPGSYRKVKLKRVKKDDVVGWWIEKLSSRLGCFFSGVLTFNGRSFTDRFRKLILVDLQNALLGSRMILAPVLYQDKFVSSELKKRYLMDRSFPYYYELLYRFDNLYDEEVFSLLEKMRVSLETVEELKDVLIKLFRSLMVLYPYISFLKTSVERALFLEKDLKGVSSAVVTDSLKNIISYIDIIFYKVYPKLFYLMDYYYKRRDRIRQSFKDFLSFSEKDSIGYYTFMWKKELEETIRKEEEARKVVNSEASVEKVEGEEEEDINKISDPVARGIKFILENINPENSLKSLVEKKDVKSVFSLRDKLFISFLILEYFDKEFSFLFTSNKVALGMVFSEGRRIDIRKDLSNLYFMVNGIFERINEYVKVLREIKKVEEDSFMSFHERGRMLNQLSIERSQLSRVIRRDLKVLFEEFTKKLLVIISDYNGEKKILANPDEILEFDVKIDGERYCNGKKVIEVIQKAYDFCSGASFLLSEGDLSGVGLLIENPSLLSGFYVSV